jgi:general secretion pathway protein E
VHIEASGSGYSTRYRVDGILRQAQAPPRELADGLLSRVKLLSDLDINERRRPQDGRFRAKVEDGRDIDVRVSFVPTSRGESLVMRLLSRDASSVDLQSLGLSGAVRDALVAKVRRPRGLVITTGPTGSGKTTTLYALLQERNPSREKIITVEDPIEYTLHGVSQIPVNRGAGVTFASALRSVLRQDPDVVLVGEIRDGETAGLAVQAALTGHLVLASLHTTTAAGALPRLKDLGVPHYLLRPTLSAVLAQRLVRKLCPECKVEGRSASTAAGVGASWDIGPGCDHCGGEGYVGRVGVFELLCSDSDGQPNGDGLSRVGGTLEANSSQMVREGLTTQREVLRSVN